ncbi:MAG TPA: hypothetical protein VM733_02975 [Thermoanaerobaculia bacterium]|nr:hypothetical protein [Thermoanaerobaculia bacterium]
MTRVEALAEEIEKLTPEEKAQLRERIDAPRAEPVGEPRKGKYSSLDIHRMLFPDGPPPYRTDAELKKEIEDAVLEDYERG